MRELQYDAVVIGAGAAGMAAALELDRAGFNTAIVEREDHLGGILMQCIHNGFGLHEFKEELTGPEFAGRFIEQVAASGITVYLDTTVTSFKAQPQGADPNSRPSNPQLYRELFCVSPQGLLHIRARTVVLAMGCRERNRGNVRIPGSRPAGV